MRTFLFILTIGLLSLNGLAGPLSMATPQRKKSGNFDKTRLLIGPGIGFGAGNRSFSLNLSPSVAYCFSEQFHLGTTLGFSYFQAADDYTNILNGQRETYKFRIPSYSWSVFGRYIIANSFVINVEPELNNTKFIKDYEYDLNTGKIVENSTRIFVPSLLLGAGYAQRLGQYGYTAIIAGYDVIQNPNARYYQTIDIRFAIMLELFR